MKDESFTSLPGGLRLPKSDPLFDAVGSLDELNAALGLLRAQLATSSDATLVESIQRDLLRLGAELATGQPQLAPAALAALETETARRMSALPPLRKFILPGDTEPSARAHFARAVCRRAERDVIDLAESEPEFNDDIIRYLNRLSDVLWLLARQVEKEA